METLPTLVPLFALRAIRRFNLDNFQPNGGVSLSELGQIFFALKKMLSGDTTAVKCALPIGMI